MKNCDLGLENAARGLRPRAAFSRPRSQFFTIRTSQPANNIYIWGYHLDKTNVALFFSLPDVFEGRGPLYTRYLVICWNQYSVKQLWRY